MTTWTDIADQSTSYTSPGDLVINGYVAEGYVVVDYIDGASMWTVVPHVSTAWI